jgi:hypothetical protein
MILREITKTNDEQDLLVVLFPTLCVDEGLKIQSQPYAIL